MSASTSSGKHATVASRRPHRRRKAERTPEIIAAGVACFIENGFAETRLEDVADRAGIAKSTIYLYFTNKEALFKAAIETRVQSVFGELDEFVADFAGKSEELLSQIILRSYERFVASDSPALLRTIIAEGERFPELRRVFYEEHLCRGGAVLERVLTRGIERGEFRDCAVTEFPRMLIAPTLMAGIWRMCFDTYEPVDIDRYARAHIDLLLNGLKS